MNYRHSRNLTSVFLGTEPETKTSLGEFKGGLRGIGCPLYGLPVRADVGGGRRVLSGVHGPWDLKERSRTLPEWSNTGEPLPHVVTALVTIRVGH